MRLHCIQHVPFEGPANLEQWAKANGHTFTKTVLYYDEDFPKMNEFDVLAILGGPLNVYEEKDYPWLKREKKFIKDAIESKKAVLGICLGAQLIADALGGKITANKEKEIGWYPVTLTPEAKKSKVFGKFPEKFMAFHWHGDTFSIPPGAVRMARSEACENQAFEYGGHVYAVQFHLESSDDSINRLAKNCSDELVDGKYIQKKEEMLSQDKYLEGIYGLMKVLLENISK
ncbi:amidotransferase [Methanocella sp. CWC-04]|uniref:Amidotransferase n=1 Tax=Methanooceanicella nereidis TaxID=2052831 RepID=A0AAP2REN1_9EURY|nr:type 1 glutamine amidotransferase [Methanocella sp. CWC-04]MCD1295145.1 amidotransferase [Methanocella sp. CWC-04]